MKILSRVSFFLLLMISTLYGAEDIEGFWKSINEETGKAESVVAVYEYQNKYYGRIIGTYNDEGKMTDTIYHPIDRAIGVVGNPFYCGLDIIWNLKDKGSRFKGKIMDPEKGHVYNAELWIRNGNLIVRGELLMFGRSQTWLPANSSDFPAGFKMPNLRSFVPAIPEAK